MSFNHNKRLVTALAPADMTPIGRSAPVNVKGWKTFTLWVIPQAAGAANDITIELPDYGIEKLRDGKE